MAHRPALCTLLATLALCGTTHAAPIAQGSFSDDLNTFDTARWMKADGWANGSPFANAWLADHITFSGGIMSIRLDNVVTLGKPYTSGNYQSNGYYGYGCYEARLKPVAASGVVSSFFTFAGPYDNGGNGKHNEIDIEFLGNNMRRFQTNFWTNDDAYAGGNEHLVDLAFDASADFHRYGFKWTSTGIEWFVDGVSVYQVLDSASRPTPKAADSLHKIMMNVWPVDATASGWAGSFSYPGTPLTGSYDSISYTAGENCSLAQAPLEAHVQSITMGLANKNTQVSATITVLDGQGRPVQSASVSGAWSGAITKGGTSGLTDANGALTLTSSKSTAKGTVNFCVKQVTAAGMSYTGSSNVETCDSIAK